MQKDLNYHMMLPNMIISSLRIKIYNNQSDKKKICRNGT